MTSLSAIKTRFKALAARQGLRKYLANTTWLLGERILRMLVLLFVGVYIARYLGPDDFGLLSYAMSFTGLFMALATLGLDGVLVRELVRAPERRDELLGTACWLKLGGALIMWLAIASVAPLAGHDTRTNILVAVVALAAVFQATNVIDFNYQAEVKSRYVVHAQLAQLIISSTVKLCFIAVGAPVLWFAWAYCLDALLLATFLGIVYLRKSGSMLIWKWKLAVATSLLKKSWPLIFSGMVISVYMKIDQVMIKAMLDTRAVGIYAAAVKLSEAWYFIPMVITSSVFPAIINSKARDNTLYDQQLKKLYNLMAWMALAIAITVSLASPWIVKTLYGDVYAAATGVLTIHIWAGIFVFIGVAGSKWLLNENLQKYHMINTSIGAAVNIALNLYLIPLYGVNGAAAATLISQAVAAYFCQALFAETRSNFIRITYSLLPAGLFSNKEKF